MAASNIEKLRLTYDIFNSDGMTDENSLANAMLTQPDKLSPVITHLAGREDRRFPLSFLTEGMNNVKELNDIEYDYPVMGRLTKAVMAVAVKGNGIGGSRVYLTFPEKRFVKQYIIESSDGLQLRIEDDAVEGDGGWVYPCVIASMEHETILESDVVGKMWSQLFAPVTPYGGSTGNESYWSAPSMMRNQITAIRKSYRFEGNAQNRVVNIEFNVPGKGKTSLWVDFEEWQYMLQWKEEIETLYWYSQYNRTKEGKVLLKDANGKIITIGSGVLEQIPNYDTYAKLTAKKLKSVVRDALYGASDAQKMNITLFTGTGGMEEFDDAMKEELAAGAYIKNTDPKSFVSGSGRNLSLGGFFTQYEHVDGHVITVRKLPLLDNGPRANNSYKHPRTGLPLESYRMIFLDMSVYDGEPNVKMVKQKNRGERRWAVAGMEIPRGFSGNNIRANDIDGASVHFFKTGGISIRRATNCIHLECVRQ
jgi:hypothetical protein